jgi:hypothetical protein
LSKGFFFINGNVLNFVEKSKRHEKGPKEVTTNLIMLSEVHVDMNQGMHLGI